MNNIHLGENAELLRILSGNDSLRDALLYNVRISLDNHWCWSICLDFRMNHRSQYKAIRLKFSDLIEYVLFSDATDSFENIERVKMFQYDRGYYLSLDPFSEATEPDPKDNDVIIAKTICAWSIDDAGPPLPP